MTVHLETHESHFYERLRVHAEVILLSINMETGDFRDEAYEEAYRHLALMAPEKRALGR